MSVVIDGDDAAALRVPVEADSWTWKDVPLPRRSSPLNTEFRWEAGRADLDMTSFVSGRWEPPAPGKFVRFPARIFFHAGYSDAQEQSVTLRRDSEPDDYCFYGPRLPFEPGGYVVDLTFRSSAPTGTKLGHFYIRTGSTGSAEQPVTSGQPASLKFRQESNLPLTLRFKFYRNADITIQSVEFRRMD